MASSFPLPIAALKRAAQHRHGRYFYGASKDETFHSVTDAEKFHLRLEKGRHIFEDSQVSTRYRYVVIEREVIPRTPTRMSPLMNRPPRPDSQFLPSTRARVSASPPRGCFLSYRNSFQSNMTTIPPNVPPTESQQPSGDSGGQKLRDQVRREIDADPYAALQAASKAIFKNAGVGTLAALAVISAASQVCISIGIKGSSAAGKSFIAERVSELAVDGKLIEATDITPLGLVYAGRSDGTDL